MAALTYPSALAAPTPSSGPSEGLEGGVEQTPISYCLPMVLPILVAAAVAASAVEVWTAGDDGLTQRFADEFRAATASFTGQPLRATVAQVTSASGDKRLYLVTFNRNGKDVSVAKCIGGEDEASRCVKRAAEAARRLLR
jgi:hypothetical protein